MAVSLHLQASNARIYARAGGNGTASSRRLGEDVQEAGTATAQGRTLRERGQKEEMEVGQMQLVFLR